MLGPSRRVRVLALVAIVVGDAADDAGGYLCGREVGVWLRGERGDDEGTSPSVDRVVRIEATMSGGDVFGVARFCDAEPRSSHGPRRARIVCLHDLPCATALGIRVGFRYRRR